MTLFWLPPALAVAVPPKSYDSRARLRRQTCPLSPPPWGSLKRKRHIMTDEPKPFIEYWEAVDAAMLKFFGIDTSGRRN